MDNLEIAKAMFGQSPQTQRNSGQTSTAYGIAMSDSSSGAVMVNLGGDTVSPDDDQQIEVETTFAVKAGDEVIISLFGADGTGKSPVVTGVVGRGDETQGEINSIRNYFWTDEHGAHVSTEERSVNGANILLDSDSLDIRNGSSNSESDQTVLASFGSVVTVGSRSSYASVGQYSQVYGINCEASGDYSHAEGFNSHAEGAYAHAEGYYVHATGGASHAEGNGTEANMAYSHAEGYGTQANGFASHAEGQESETSNSFAHAEGYKTTASGQYSHVEGGVSVASGNYSHAEGYMTEAKADYSHVEGYQCTNLAPAFYSHVEGNGSHADAIGAHAEGNTTTASGSYSHGEGYFCTANGSYSHAEGYKTTSSGNYSHCQGRETVASGTYSHCEGYLSKSQNEASHAEGYSCTASGNYSHAEGNNTQANWSAHAEGLRTYADSGCSHAEGLFTHTLGRYQHAQGIANALDNNYEYLDIIGNGTVDDEASPTTVLTRSNAYELDRSGNAEFQGEVYVGGCKLNGETPYPVVRYNTSNSKQEYYDKANSTWAQVPGGGGGGSWTSLWTNSAPSSNFSAQTVPLDLSGYTWVAIIAHMSTSGTADTTHFVRVGSSVVLNCPNLGSTQYFYKREASVASNGITFGTGYRNNTGTSGANYCIPIAIYGIC